VGFNALIIASDALTVKFYVVDPAAYVALWAPAEEAWTATHNPYLTLWITSAIR
jgi:hypothetical protein